MLRDAAETALELASVGLFVAMVAVWAFGVGPLA